MRKLDFYLREVKEHEVPIEARRGKTGGFIGHFVKEENEEFSKEKPIVLFNKNLRFLAFAHYMKSEDTEKEGKIKYLVDMNYNESRLNPRLSPKDYFIGIPFYT